MISHDEDFDKANLVLTVDTQRGLQSLFDYIIYLDIKVESFLSCRWSRVLFALSIADGSSSLFLSIHSFAYRFRNDDDWHVSVDAIQASDHQLVGYDASFHHWQRRRDYHRGTMSTGRGFSQYCSRSVQSRERDSSAIRPTIRRWHLHMLATVLLSLSIVSSRW